MLRSVAVILSALALSAGAQETSMPEEEEEKPAPNAPAPAAEGAESPTVLASIETVAGLRSPPPLSAPAARSDAGIDVGRDALQAVGDCGLEDAIFENKALPVAVRIYGPAEMA